MRAYLITEMRHRGIQRLRISKDWDIGALKVALKPDQRAWLCTWLTSAAASNSLNKLLKALAYKPLEM